MLRLARADSGNFVLQPRHFHMDETLLETVQAAAVLAIEKRIRITVEDIPEAPCYGDEDLVRQMVLNLLDNAVKYTPERGEIRLALGRSNGSYLIRVADNGSGIPPEAQSYIFERFYRVGKARSRNDDSGLVASSAQGAGLGLAIARWIAEIHGGTLRLERSDTSGSTFLATLPLESAASEAPPGPSQV
jgi:signal transduction histidine kinase